MTYEKENALVFRHINILMLSATLPLLALLS